MSVKKLTYISLFTALIIISGMIHIPLPNQDYFTLQTPVVLLAGMLLGPRCGSAAVAVFIILGLMGVPVFAAGGGPAYVLRPSFGYLLGYILAAYLVGYLTRHKTKLLSHHSFAAFIALFSIYAIGLPYKYAMLHFYAGEALPFTLILLSVFPLDLPGDVLLTLVAIVIGRRLEKVVQPC